MPLKLIPPGQRGNRYWVVRGRYLGIDVETSTQKSDKADAQGFRDELERRIAAGQIPGAQSKVKFHKAIDLYSGSRSLSRDDERRFRRIKEAQPDKPVSEITQVDIDTLAQVLHGNDSPETRNRNVYTPVISVLRYAAKNRWCHPLAFDRPKQKRPETRAASDNAAQALLDATGGRERLFLLWLFYHGSRVTNALAVAWERIDLDGETYQLWVAKSRQWRVFPIHDVVMEELRAVPPAERAGKLFPWRDRWVVYDWLVPLRDRLGVAFTPHMARHWLGKQLDAAGAGQRAIADALGQASTRSTQRYTSSDVETVRRFGKKLGKLR